MNRRKNRYLKKFKKKSKYVSPVVLREGIQETQTVQIKNKKRKF
jgi:hypothetical protein